MLFFFLSGIELSMASNTDFSFNRLADERRVEYKKAILPELWLELIKRCVTHYNKYVRIFNRGRTYQFIRNNHCAVCSSPPYLCPIRRKTCYLFIFEHASICKDPSKKQDALTAEASYYDPVFQLFRLLNLSLKVLR